MPAISTPLRPAALLLLACLLLGAWRVVTRAPGWLALNQGMAAWRDQRLTPAALALTQATQRQPLAGPAWRALGRLLLQQDQPAAARQALQQALARQPHDPLTHLELARSLAGLGADAPALTHYRLAGWPAYVSLRRQAQSLLTASDAAQADRLAEQAAAVMPTRPEAFYLWGETRWAQADHPAAVALWQRGVVLAQSPATALDLYYQGRIALALGDPAAVEILRSAWRLDPTFPWTGLWLGEALLAAGQPDAAAAVWQQQVQRFPANPWAGRRLQELAARQTPSPWRR